MIYLWITVGIVIVLIIGVIVIFNSLIRKRNRVKNAWSDIEVQLKRRYDLVPNLVEVVKGYIIGSISVGISRLETGGLGTLFGFGTNYFNYTTGDILEKLWKLSGLGCH